MMPAAAPSEAPAPGKTICISQQADGSFSVGDHEAYMSQQGGEAEGMLETGAEGGMEESAMTPAATIDEALDLVRGLLEGPQTEQMSIEQAFQGGFEGSQQA